MHVFASEYFLWVTGLFVCFEQLEVELKCLGERMEQSNRELNARIVSCQELNARSMSAVSKCLDNGKFLYVMITGATYVLRTVYYVQFSGWLPKGSLRMLEE